LQARRYGPAVVATKGRLDEGKEESLIGTLAVLGVAAALAYLGPEHPHPPEGQKARSDEKAPALDALSSGRGRHAQSPTAIPSKGWKDILWRTYEQWISIGSVVATITWMIGSGLLSYYLANFGNYDATYGSLGAAIALMIWMWMSTIVVLFGAELNSEIEHQTAADSRDGVEKPLGSRGAKMADTLGVSR
jgi:hypothetical protein